MLRGASAEALAELSSRPVGTGTLDDAGDARATSCSGSPASLRGEPALRRVAHRRLGRGRGQGGPGRRRCSAASRRRRRRSPWSRTPSRGAGPAPRDLADVLERARRRSRPVRSAGAQGDAGRRRAVRGPSAHRRQPRRCASALSDPTRTADDRQRAAPGLLDGKVLPATQRARRPGGQPAAAAAVDAALAGVPRRGGRRRSSEARRHRAHRPRAAADASSSGWPTALGKQYGTRPSSCTSSSTPSLIGGLRVEIGDDVIDGTVASRLDDARRRLAG